MKIIYNSIIKAFVCQSTFAEKDIPKSAGFKWDPQSKTWQTPELRVARKLEKCFEDSAIQEAQKMQAEKDVAIQESLAVSSSINIPIPKGLTYYPFQKAGIEFANKRNNILLADEMGLGKSIEVAGVINLQDIAIDILIVCPASLKLNWKRELEKWLVSSHYKIVVVNGEWETADITIIAYSMLTKYSKEIHSKEWNLLVLDEAQYIKEKKAKRTQEIIGHWNKETRTYIPERIQAKKKMLLSGTPIVNKPVELWTLANYLDPQNFNDFMQYAKRYCNAAKNRWGWDFSGASHLDELQEKLRASIMIRRLKKDVLKELPEKIKTLVIESPNKKDKKVMEQLEIENDLANENGVDFSSPESFSSSIQKLKSSMIAFSEISKVRHQTALLKLPYLIEYLKDVLENTEKLVVFGHHHDVLNGIFEEFKDVAVLLTGETPQEERLNLVDRFQTDPNVKLFVGSTLASGVGFTLTASNTVVIAELGWTPAEIEQAIDRCHRIGQTETVWAYYFVFENSLDCNIAKMLIAKQENIEKILNK